MPRTRSIAWAELKLGLIGIGATALAVMVIIAVGGQAGFFWERYPLKTQMTDAQGLKSGAVVRVAGKDVGSVASVEFAGTVIEIVFEVNEDVRPLITDRSPGRTDSRRLGGTAGCVDSRLGLRQIRRRIGHRQPRRYRRREPQESGRADRRGSQRKGHARQDHHRRIALSRIGTVRGRGRRSGGQASCRRWNHRPPRERSVGLEFAEDVSRESADHDREAEQPRVRARPVPE